MPRLSCGPTPAIRIICAAKLHGLSKAIMIYSEDRDKYPDPNNWYDSLILYMDVDKEMFICAKAERNRNPWPGHYAINPDCKKDSEPDTVLLFETTGGWNQHGGKDLITTKNHDGRGCSVCFNGGYVKFIKAKDFNDLKWQ